MRYAVILLVIHFRDAHVAGIGLRLHLTGRESCTLSTGYYKVTKLLSNEFKGAAFTGTVITSHESAREDKGGEKLQELTIEVDRYWFGVRRRTMAIYAPKNRCWKPFREGEKYFFIPAVEDGILYGGVRAYATYNPKPDGNYVEFMSDMFGPRKTFTRRRN